jgi:hypothetical protein
MKVIHGTCANCKYSIPRLTMFAGDEAEPSETFAPKELSLLCMRAGGDPGWHGSETFRTDYKNTKHAIEVSEWGRLTVHPDFGCVEWELKIPNEPGVALR